MKSLVNYILESKWLTNSQLKKLNDAFDKYIEDPKKADNWHTFLKDCKSIHKDATYSTNWFMEVTFHKHEATAYIYDIDMKRKYEWAYDNITEEDNVAFNKNDLDDRIFLLKDDQKKFAMYLPDDIGNKIKKYYESK